MESIYPSIKSVNEPLLYKSYNHLAIAFTTPETQVSTDYQISGYFCNDPIFTFFGNHFNIAENTMHRNNGQYSIFK